MLSFYSVNDNKAVVCANAPLDSVLRNPDEIHISPTFREAAVVSELIVVCATFDSHRAQIYTSRMHSHWQ